MARARGAGGGRPFRAPRGVGGISPTGANAQRPTRVRTTRTGRPVNAPGTPFRANFRLTAPTRRNPTGVDRTH